MTRPGRAAALVLLLALGGAAVGEAVGGEVGEGAADAVDATVTVASPAARVGGWLPIPPSVPPGRVAPLPADPLRAAIDRRTQGDPAAAAWFYEQALAEGTLTGRTKAAAQLALGITRLELGHANLAAADFAKVKASGTPVASWGWWYLARAEHARGHHAAAAQACAGYRAKWPEGPYADECLVLIGDANVAAGQRGAAVAAYQAYLELHPDTPREETLRLGIALAVSTSDPRAAIPMLQELAVDHAYHSTGETATERLAQLAAEGHPAALPDTVTWRCRQAVELKKCGFEDEAWERYQALATLAAEDPELARWVDAQEDRFAWGTKQYEQLAQRLAEAYAKTPTAELAWNRYKALSRGGMWPEATVAFEQGMKNHPTSGSFKSRELYARGLLLAGRWDDAVTTWTALGKGGGALGREARFLAAYASFRGGDLEGALPRLDAVIAGGGDEALAGRYYRARALDQLGRADEARAEREAILKAEPLSWYAVLIRSERAFLAGPSAVTPRSGQGVTVPAPPAEAPAHAGVALWRAGRWPGPAAPTLPALPRVGTGGVAVSAPVVGAPDDGRTIDWAAWRDGAAPAAAPAPRGTNGVPAAPRAGVGPGAVTGERRPDSYQPGFLFDPAEGDRLLSALGASHGAVFPWAGAAADLARVGLFHEAAPLVARMYDAWEAARDGDAIPATPAVKAGTSRDALRAVAYKPDEWRQIFYFARDDHHAAKSSWGTTKLASTPEERDVALRRAFPTAEIDALYRHGEAQSVDPFMMLGLMRQESVYRQWALSHVGAIGLLQIMPRTGARVAALMGDPHYSPEILEDPATNVRYGVWYMARLLDRFEGAWPLAVASYNGGPHNVSSWLRPWGPTVRMDDFVEQIPYGETKNYVKKVAGYYATYLALYGPPGARVDVPPTPLGDHPEVIDF